MAEQPAALPQIAGYAASRMLGRGALGTVYLATAPDGSAPVALKVLPLLDDNRTLFQQSCAAARRLQHRAIAAVLDAGIVGQYGWIAMELAPGLPLERYTAPARLLPLAVVQELGLALAEALAHAHELGVVHRDVKPANALVHLPGRSLKLVDFGLARLADAERTRTGLVIGSPAYMAPEQLAGAAATPAGDLYGLGATLFQLLSGRLPHEPGSMGDWLRRVATEPPPALHSLRPEIPAALAALVARLLAKSPADRPSTASEVAASLRAQLKEG